MRLSFLYGNYTTLTSITEDEMQRVIEQRLSPQYVSVHATDLEVRAYLLGIDTQRADITHKMQRMLDASFRQLERGTADLPGAWAGNGWAS